MTLVDRVLYFFFGARPTPAHRQTPAPHALDDVCAKFQCQYERSVFPTGEVQVMLRRADATLTAVGPTTAAAVERIVAKANACWGSLV
jgi:hypothetical protein